MTLEFRNGYSEDNILKDQLVSESDLVSLLEFKAFGKELKDKVSEKMIVWSLKMASKMIASKPEGKEIIQTRGDVEKYKPFGYAKDVTLEMTNSSSSVGGSVPEDFKAALSTLHQIQGILTNGRDSKEFRRAFNKNNVAVINLYAALVVSFCMGALRLFTAYSFIDDGGSTKISTENKNIMKTSNFQNMRNFINIHRSGHFNKAYAISGTDTDEESVSEGVEANLHFSTDSFKIVDMFKGLAHPKKTGDEKKDAANSRLGNSIKTVGTLLIIVVTTRYILSKWYVMKVKLSDSLRDSANIIDENIYGMADGKSRERQIKMSERLRKLADRVDIDDSVSDSKSDKMMRDLDRKILDDSKNEENLSSFDLGF